MDLSVITVTWNSERRIAEQIISVALGCRNITCEHIIVDNNSSDKTVEIIKKTSKSVDLFQNKSNFGFAKANNMGFSHAKGEFILFLNPDMRVREFTLDPLVNWMHENKDIGIAGGMLLNPDKTVNKNTTPRRFPKLFDQLAIVFKLHHIFPHILDKYMFRDFDSRKEQEVDSVQGSFMIVRRELLEKLGRAFDERYYIWFEDVDLCREAKKLGYKVMYTPKSTCIDYGGESFAKRSVIWKQVNFIKSMVKYFKKWNLEY
jgi:GT2 family glycosyltransferase